MNEATGTTFQPELSEPSGTPVTTGVTFIVNSPSDEQNS